MNPFKLTLLALFLTLCSAAARCEENSLIFKDAAFPITVPVAQNASAGAVIYETRFSEAPPKDYDTVLIEGEMPDPGVRVQIKMKNGAAFKTYSGDVLHRFPSGRFWVKYRIAPVSREPLKIVLVSAGTRAAHSLTIYDAETFRESLMRETQPAASMENYTPDPGFYLPQQIPFAVVRRETWNAAPPKEPYTPHSPKMFTLHHTQAHFPKNYDEAVQEMQFIQDYHQNGRGWIDIGYHFLISPQGDIFEGRPVNVVGAHVKNMNTGNVGISIMGNYHPPVSQVPTEATVHSFIELGKYLKTEYDISISSFYAHRDIGQTDCPGDVLYAKMPEFKALIFQTDPPPAPAPMLVDPSFSTSVPERFVSLNQLLEYSDK